MQIVKAALLYFALFFGAGFVLGTIRSLWAARLGVPSMPSARLGIGSVAFGLMFVAEFGPYAVASAAFRDRV